MRREKMGAIDVAEASEEEVECENCGTVHTDVVPPLEVCQECCPHDDVTESALIGGTCNDCGARGL